MSKDVICKTTDKKKKINNIIGKFEVSAQSIDDLVWIITVKIFSIQFSPDY
jgi:hypothetical protein